MRVYKYNMYYSYGYDCGRGGDPEIGANAAPRSCIMYVRPPGPGR